MARFIDISGWTNNEWSSPSKGSRPQKIFSNPETDEEYFFKQSSAKYPAEFWSEIIASEIGLLAGFPLLTYDAASYHGTLGCLSKSMVPNTLHQLYHGIDVLRDYLPGFQMSNKPVHSFQQIMTLCEQTGEFRPFKKNFIQIILFDALIGNTDRHTENWAFIIELHFIPQKPTDFKLIPKRSWRNYIPFLKSKITYDLEGRLDLKVKRTASFSPIYDSGSCLGRELTDQRMHELLTNKRQLSSYLDRSKHEICWNDKKINSFELVCNVAKAEPEIFQEVSDLFFGNITAKKMIKTIDDIDSEVVGKVGETYLSLPRKSLIKALLVARFERLKEYLSVS
ncbi:MAG: hypothetical protein ABIN80_20920 [Dyadobacter sp.]|uniref:hypothetical protein n=1 Tax=Dyadobacter sp. TaxID=1914288 RepID=UPI00326743C4